MKYPYTASTVGIVVTPRLHRACARNTSFSAAGYALLGSGVCLCHHLARLPTHQILTAFHLLEVGLPGPTGAPKRPEEEVDIPKLRRGLGLLSGLGNEVTRHNCYGGFCNETIATLWKSSFALNVD